MSFADTFSYFIAVVMIAIAPGPVALMLMVRAASNDTKGAAAFGLGYIAGGVLIVSAVCYGLGTWLTATPQIFEYGKFVMMAYICWLAWDIWKGGFDMNGTCEVTHATILSSITAGLITCFISPYMMILFPLVISDMIDITVFKLPEFIFVGVVTFLALATGAALIIFFAAQLSRFARSAHSTLMLNRSLATILVGVGGWIALA